MEHECISCKVKKTSEKFFNKYICFLCINDLIGDICCLKCKVVKHKTEYYKKKTNKWGIDTFCKICRKSGYISKKISNSPQLQTGFIENIYNKYEEFIEKYLIKTNYKNDKVYVSVLFLKYMSKTYSLKYNPTLIFFTEKMEEYLGKYEGQRYGFRGYLENENEIK